MQKYNLLPRALVASMALAAAAITAPPVVHAADTKPDPDAAKLNSVIKGPCKTEFDNFISETQHPLYKATKDPLYADVIILKGEKVEKAAAELVACERAHGAKPPAKLVEIANQAPK